VSDISIEFRTAPAGESTAHGQTVAAQEEALANLEQVVLSDSRQTAAAATPR
jgi:hypothetical protein